MGGDPLIGLNRSHNFEMRGPWGDPPCDLSKPIRALLNRSKWGVRGSPQLRDPHVIGLDRSHGGPLTRGDRFAPEFVTFDSNSTSGFIESDVLKSTIDNKVIEKSRHILDLYSRIKWFRRCHPLFSEKVYQRRNCWWCYCLLIAFVLPQ